MKSLRRASEAVWAMVDVIATPTAGNHYRIDEVCGAHMSGLALNHELTTRGGRLLSRTQTATCYRLYLLPGGPPQRPGLVRVGDGGAAIELEVWALPATLVGDFIAGIPAPLGIGRVTLADGTEAAGFVCEAYAVCAAWIFPFIKVGATFSRMAGKCSLG